MAVPNANVMTKPKTTQPKIIGQCSVLMSSQTHGSRAILAMRGMPAPAIAAVALTAR
jgi:hypothetical protein